MSTTTTDYTRLGAWRHQVSAHAADALATQSYERGDRGLELGAFAYSPLAPTAVYSSADHRLYPAAGATSTVSATYAGQTAAAQGDLFYTGAVEARVYWDPSDVEDSEVRVTITDLVDNDSGDPLQYGFAREGFPVAGAVDVESLSWTASIEQDGVVKFSTDTDVTVGVDSISGAPRYRPQYTQLPPGGTTLEYGGGILDRRLRHYTGDSQSQLRISLLDGDQTNYWVIKVGDGTAGEFGPLTFWGTGTGRQTTTLVTTGSNFETQKARFEAGQEALVYPTHLVRGITVAPPGSPSATRNSLILLFADGSTMHMDANFDHNQDPFGASTRFPNPPSGRQATNFDGTPLLSDNNNALLYYEMGQAWSKDLLTEDGNEDVIGQGAPEMTPSQIAARFFAEGGYVNLTADQSADALDGKIDGMFVGQDQDGPLGIIGTWELTGGAFGVGTERGVIRGAFGADIQP